MLRSDVGTRRTSTLRSLSRAARRTGPSSDRCSLRRSPRCRQRLLLPDPLPDSAPQKADKRFKVESIRTTALGNNPKKAHSAARASLQEATFLPFLGDCYMVLGLDYFRFQFTGKSILASTHFDGACKLYAKKGAVRVQESDGTETSSTTSAGDLQQ